MDQGENKIVLNVKDSSSLDISCNNRLVYINNPDKERQKAKIYVQFVVLDGSLSMLKSTLSDKIRSLYDEGKECPLNVKMDHIMQIPEFIHYIKKSYERSDTSIDLLEAIKASNHIDNKVSKFGVQLLIMEQQHKMVMESLHRLLLVSQTSEVDENEKPFTIILDRCVVSAFSVFSTHALKNGEISDAEYNILKKKCIYCLDEQLNSVKSIIKVKMNN